MYLDQGLRFYIWKALYNSDEFKAFTMAQSLSWFCRYCGAGPMNYQLEIHCWNCGRLRDAYSRIEDSGYVGTFFRTASGPIVPCQDPEMSNTANGAPETTIQNSSPIAQTELPFSAGFGPASSYRAAASLDDSAKEGIQSPSGILNRLDTLGPGHLPDIEISIPIAGPSWKIPENDDESDASVLPDNESISDKLSVSSMSSVGPPEFADELFWEFRNNEIITSLIRVAIQSNYDPFIKTFGTLLRKYGTELGICADSPIEKGASRLVIAQSNSLARRLYEHFKKGVSPDLDSHGRVEEIELRLAHFDLKEENYAIPRLEQVKDFLFGGQPFSKLVERVKSKLPYFDFSVELAWTTGDNGTLPKVGEQTMPNRVHREGKSRDLSRPEIDTKDPVRNKDSKYRTDFNAGGSSEARVPFSGLVALVLLVLRFKKRRTLIKAAEDTEPPKGLSPQQLAGYVENLDTDSEVMAGNESNSHYRSPQNQQINKWLLGSPNYLCSSDNENTRLLKSGDGIDSLEWICVSSLTNIF